MTESNVNSSEEVKNSSFENNGLDSVENPTISNETMSILTSAGIVDTTTGKIKADILTELMKVQSFSGAIKPVFRFTYKDVIAAGGQFVFDTENRDINFTHVKRLYKSVKEDSSKTFMEPIKVMPALDALKKGIKLVDAKGNKVDENTVGIEKMLLVLDGQHRINCALIHSEIDVPVELINIPGNAMQYYGVVNGLKLKQNGSDTNHSITTRFDEKANLLIQMKRFSEVYGISEKCAERWLTGKVDQVKLSEKTKLMQDGVTELPEKFHITDEAIERADALVNAIIWKFGNSKKCKKLDLATAVMSIYGSAFYEHKDSFVTDFTAFLVEATTEEQQQILDMVGSKQEDFNSALATMFKSYLELTTSDARQKAVELKKNELEEHKAKKVNATDGTKKKKAPTSYWVEKYAEKANSSSVVAPLPPVETSSNDEDEFNPDTDAEVFLVTKENLKLCIGRILAFALFDSDGFQIAEKGDTITSELIDTIPDSETDCFMVYTQEFLDCCKAKSNE